MKCGNCGHANRAGVKFCEECGQILKSDKGKFCPECGFKNRAGVKFCENCGATLEQPSAVQPEQVMAAEPKREREKKGLHPLIWVLAGVAAAFILLLPGFFLGAIRVPLPPAPGTSILPEFVVNTWNGAYNYQTTGAFATGNIPNVINQKAGNQQNANNPMIVNGPICNEVWEKAKETINFQTGPGWIGAQWEGQDLLLSIFDMGHAKSAGVDWENTSNMNYEVIDGKGQTVKFATCKMVDNFTDATCLLKSPDNDVKPIISKWNFDYKGEHCSIPINEEVYFACPPKEDLTINVQKYNPVNGEISFEVKNKHFWNDQNKYISDFSLKNANNDPTGIIKCDRKAGDIKTLVCSGMASRHSGLRFHARYNECEIDSEYFNPNDNLFGLTGNCPLGGDISANITEWKTNKMTMEITNKMGWSASSMSTNLKDAKGSDWATLDCIRKSDDNKIMICKGTALGKTGTGSLSFTYSGGGGACSISDLKFPIPCSVPCQGTCCLPGYRCCPCGCKLLDSSTSCSSACS